MIDVFVSYASADRERVAPLAQALLDHGWSVWWDRQIPPGKTFDEVIEAALDQAKVVLAVWTQAGVASPWVRTEAAEGAARGILVPVLAELVPVLAEDVRIPLAFRRIQAADLTDWAPGQEHPGFTELIDAINELTRIEPAEELQPPKPEDPVERAMLAAQARAAERDWEGVIGLLGPLEANTPHCITAGRLPVHDERGTTRPGLCRHRWRVRDRLDQTRASTALGLSVSM